MVFNFDQTKWYQVNVTSFDGLSLASSALNNKGVGSVFFQITNATADDQKWQFFPGENSTWIARSKKGGPQAYITTGIGNSSDPNNTGDTVPSIRNYTLSDDSMYWTVNPWNDGTYFMLNEANGTKWHLDVADTALMTMSSNISAPQKGQSYSFAEVGDINDNAYSSVQTVAKPTATVAPTESTKGASTGAAAAQAGSDSSSGLSTGAKIGIGVGVGGAVLLALIIGALIMCRHSRKSRQNRQKVMESSTTEYAPLPRYELPQNQAPEQGFQPIKKQPTERAELGAGIGTQVEPAEVDARNAVAASSPVELPSSPIRGR